MVSGLASLRVDDVKEGAPKELLAVRRYISKHHMSVKGSECQVSELVNSDTCLRPTTRQVLDALDRVLPHLRTPDPPSRL